LNTKIYNHSSIESVYEEPTKKTYFNARDTKLTNNSTTKAKSLNKKILKKNRDKDKYHKKLKTRDVKIHNNDKIKSSGTWKKLKNGVCTIISSLTGKKSKSSKLEYESLLAEHTATSSSLHTTTSHLKENDSHQYSVPCQHNKEENKKTINMRKCKSEEVIYVNNDVLRQHIPRKPPRQRFSQVYTPSA
jgi:hypothetical protein